MQFSNWGHENASKFQKLKYEGKVIRVISIKFCIICAKRGQTILFCIKETYTIIYEKMSIQYTILLKMYLNQILQNAQRKFKLKT